MATRRPGRRIPREELFSDESTPEDTDPNLRIDEADLDDDQANEPEEPEESPQESEEKSDDSEDEPSLDEIARTARQKEKALKEQVKMIKAAIEQEDKDKARHTQAIKEAEEAIRGLNASTAARRKQMIDLEKEIEQVEKEEEEALAKAIEAAAARRRATQALIATDEAESKRRHKEENPRWHIRYKSQLISATVAAGATAIIGLLALDCDSSDGSGPDRQSNAGCAMDRATGNNNAAPEVAAQNAHVAFSEGSGDSLLNRWIPDFPEGSGEAE